MSGNGTKRDMKNMSPARLRLAIRSTLRFNSTWQYQWTSTLTRSEDSDTMLRAVTKTVARLWQIPSVREMPE
jgi:hypothetical protein